VRRSERDGGRALGSPDAPGPGDDCDIPLPAWVWGRFTAVGVSANQTASSLTLLGNSPFTEHRLA
jgi:hypothetical protein